MSLLSDFQEASALRLRAARAVSVQIGLVNPFWVAYGAAASAGAAWWMMAKSWQPVNLEAAAVADDLPAPEVEIEAVVETNVEAVDDLMRLVGVGPRSAAALAERGVATFADLAAWTAEDLAAFDAELKLKGRSVRNAWLEQARAFAAG